ncbi:MAG: putative zinc-binding metallopeptidase [Alistipes sp.]|nr:putative zinc-binding metallopeptidase [Alistipes sp.]
MKTYISIVKKSLLLLALPLTLAACQKDELREESIFQDEVIRYTEFDAWLQRNYVDPYNVRVEYHMPDRETGMNYWVSPPPVDKSIEVAKLIKYTTLDAMAEMMDDGRGEKDPMLFAKTYFPKVLFLVGNFQISNTGSVALASAENGLQINILGVNYFVPSEDGERIAGTMLHEFMHILDSTYPSPSEFKTVTASDYVGSRYTSMGNDYLQKGFVSNYARSSVAEDVAETGGRLITTTDEVWEQWYAQAGPEGGAKLRKKHDLLKKWLLDFFGVDTDRWRESYLRRINNLENLDWQSLDD